MQSQINQKPPSLPPKPRIGSGMASTPSRGPPPPVTPRTSSLLPNQTGKSDSPDPSSSSAVELSDTEINLKPSDSGKTGFTGKSGPSSDCDISQSKEDKFSSPHPEKSAGSESSRGFEPEGWFSLIPCRCPEWKVLELLFSAHGLGKYFNFRKNCAKIFTKS